MNNLNSANVAMQKASASFANAQSAACIPATRGRELVNISERLDVLNNLLLQAVANLGSVADRVLGVGPEVDHEVGVAGEPSAIGQINAQIDLLMGRASALNDLASRFDRLG